MIIKSLGIAKSSGMAAFPAAIQLSATTSLYPSPVVARRRLGTRTGTAYWVKKKTSAEDTVSPRESSESEPETEDPQGDDHVEKPLPTLQIKPLHQEKPRADKHQSGTMPTEISGATTLAPENTGVGVCNNSTTAPSNQLWRDSNRVKALVKELMHKSKNADISGGTAAASVEEPDNQEDTKFDISSSYEVIDMDICDGESISPQWSQVQDQIAQAGLQSGEDMVMTAEKPPKYSAACQYDQEATATKQSDSLAGLVKAQEQWNRRRNVGGLWGYPHRQSAPPGGWKTWSLVQESTFLTLESLCNISDSSTEQIISQHLIREIQVRVSMVSYSKKQ